MAIVENTTEEKPAVTIAPTQEEPTMHEPKQSESMTTKDESVRFQENEAYIVKTLTAAGLPLVLRSEQSTALEEEIKKDILNLLQENENLKISLLNAGKPFFEDDEYLLKAANFYYITGSSQKAAEMYDDMLKRNPTKMAALNNKGVILDSFGEYDDALKYFEEALSKVPENVHLLSNKGITLYKTEKYEPALECFDAALKIDLNYTNALTFKAHSLYRLGKNSEALEWYNKVIRLDRNNAEALYNKACLCSLKGDNYGAITSLEKAVRLDPSWKEAALQDKDLDGIKNDPRFRDALK